MENIDSIQKQVEQWRAQQSDLIECPLGARLRLKSCKDRQRSRFRHSTDNLCLAARCEHYREKPKPQSQKEAYQGEARVQPPRAECLRAMSLQSRVTPYVCGNSVFASDDGPEPRPAKEPKTKPLPAKNAGKDTAIDPIDRMIALVDQQLKEKSPKPIRTDPELFAWRKSRKVAKKWRLK